MIGNWLLFLFVLFFLMFFVELNRSYFIRRRIIFNVSYYFFIDIKDEFV